MPPTPDQLAKQLAQLLRQSNVVQGQTRGGSAGQSIPVTLQDGRSVRAIATNPCPPGPVTALQTENGQWYAVGQNQDRVVGERIVKTRKYKAQVKDVYPFKILFSLGQDIYLGGDRPTPIKILTAPAGTYIYPDSGVVSCTGPGKSSWIVQFSYQIQYLVDALVTVFGDGRPTIVREKPLFTIMGPVGDGYWVSGPPLVRTHNAFDRHSELLNGTAFGPNQGSTSYYPGSTFTENTPPGTVIIRTPLNDPPIYNIHSGTWPIFMVTSSGELQQQQLGSYQAQFYIRGDSSGGFIIGESDYEVFAAAGTTQGAYVLPDGTTRTATTEFGAFTFDALLRDNPKSFNFGKAIPSELLAVYGIAFYDRYIQPMKFDAPQNQSIYYHESGFGIVETNFFVSVGNEQILPNPWGQRSYTLNRSGAEADLDLSALPSLQDIVTFRGDRICTLFNHQPDLFFYTRYNEETNQSDYRVIGNTRLPAKATEFRLQAGGNGYRAVKVKDHRAMVLPLKFNPDDPVEFHILGIGFYPP